MHCFLLMIDCFFFFFFKKKIFNSRVNRTSRGKGCRGERKREREKKKHEKKHINPHYQYQLILSNSDRMICGLYKGRKNQKFRRTHRSNKTRKKHYYPLPPRKNSSSTPDRFYRSSESNNFG